MAPDRSPHATQRPAPVRFLAQELSRLPERIAAIEAVVSDLALRAPPDAATRIALQDLDHLRQTVEDLARLSMAAADDTATTGHLAEELRLHDLKERLLGTLVPSRPATVERNGGIVDLFAPATGPRDS
jgi:hypothetical protein